MTIDDLHQTADADRERPLSATAVASLVLGLLFCVPGLGLVGAALGAIGVAVTGPTGTRRGRGMAVAGLVLSGLTLVGWIVVGVGMKEVWQTYVAPAMIVVEQGPERTLRATFDGDATASAADWMPGTAPNDVDRAAFVAGLTEVMGAFQSASIEAGAQPPAGAAGEFDLPFEFRFEQGTARGSVAFRASSQGETTPGGSYLGIAEIRIETPDGKVFTLPPLAAAPISGEVDAAP